MNIPLSVAIVIAAALLSIIGSLIVVNLRAIKSCVRSFTQRVEKQEKQAEKTEQSLNKTNDEIKSLNNDFTKCKVDCERSFVRDESFLRETGFLRRSMDTLTQSVNRMEGSLRVVEKLPQICGDISREIVKEMKNGGDSHG